MSSVLVTRFNYVFLMVFYQLSRRRISVGTDNFDSSCKTHFPALSCLVTATSNPCPWSKKKARLNIAVIVNSFRPLSIHFIGQWQPVT
ncbi:hypothetical protein CHS0354_041937 [Potamilus streckersoni]|uniref:Uncharacterized protein n=1 Tax=Potamilus streckersoni TaxID=2493646 RepID=A0AAE0T9J0_9BIVA|nr:hypothetical protein CHS0354_041937 [Potamilus streckersoni]